MILLCGCSEEEPAAPTLPDEPGEIVPRVLVLNSLSETISSLDLTSNELTVFAAPAGAWPNRLLSVPDLREIAVVASGDNEIESLSQETLTRLDAVDLGPGNNPWMATLWQDRVAIVTNWLSGQIVEVDLAERKTGRRLATSASGPEGVLVVDDRAYVACSHYDVPHGAFLEGRLDAIDLAAWQRDASIAVARNPQDVKLAPDGTIHVLCTGTYGNGAAPEAGKVSIVDPITLQTIHTVEIGGSPGRFAMASGGVAWVAGFEGGIRRYDAQARVLLPPPSDPDLASPGFSAIAWDSAGSTVYVASFEADLLIAVDEAAGSIRNAWIVGDGPIDILVLR
jgi:DNA-binding beta-propeller fold protein YncE